MADSISIVMKLNDEISGKLKTIASTSQGCSKAMEDLARKGQQLGDRYNYLNKRSAEASAQALEVKRAMDEAAKMFKKTGDEADRLNFEKLKEQYNDLTVSAKGYADEAKNTVKEIRALSDEVRKMDDAGGIGQSGTVPGTPAGGLLDGSMIQKIGSAGLYKMAGDAISQFAGFSLESAIGQPMAAFTSSMISGAASGAAIGSIVPGIGTALGAAAGAGIGAISGGTQILTEQDEAFKDYYKSLYENTNAATAEGLTSGSTLAAGRETTKLSFNTLLGDDKKAAVFLEQVQNTANTTPFLYDDLVGISKTMLSFGTAVDDIIPTLTKVGDAGAALGLGTSDIGTVATYLGRMKSSDKATLEYLNPLNERGFSVFQWLADDQGVSVGDVYSQISKGELSGSYVSDVILSQFEKLYAGMMDIQSKSTEGLDSTLQGLKENVDAAGGDAYNTLRNDSKEADIAAYSGPLGDKLAELSAAAGEAKAYGENLSDQYQREALNAVLLGDLDKETTVFAPEDAEKLEGLRQQFSEAEEAYKSGSVEAGQKMVDLKEEAEALATAAYESSEWAQSMRDAEIDQIDATRELTQAMVSATDAWRQNNAFSKGNMAGSVLKVFGIGRTAEDEEARLGELKSMDEGAALASVGDVGVLEAMGYYKNSHAFGLKYVPYDEYPALLHQGERVLTAAEARTMDRLIPSPEPEFSGMDKGLDDWAAGTFAFGLNSVPYDNFPALLHQGERVTPPTETRGGGDVHVDLRVDSINVQGGGEDMVDEIAAALMQKLRVALLRGGG